MILQLSIIASKTSSEKEIVRASVADLIVAMTSGKVDSVNNIIELKGESCVLSSIELDAIEVKEVENDEKE